MKVINAKLMKKFVGLLPKHVTGEWVLFGGTLLHLLNIAKRTTTDIDVSPIESGDILELMNLADELGLSVEGINQAGSFFLKKIPNYIQDLVLVKEWKTGALFRPNINLFIKLKSNRLTESDLSDCIEMIKWARKNNEVIDSKGLLKYFKIAKGNSARLKKLIDVIDR